jgi:hypothetical protein
MIEERLMFLSYCSRPTESLTAVSMLSLRVLRLTPRDHHHSLITSITSPLHSHILLELHMLPAFTHPPRVVHVAFPTISDIIEASDTTPSRGIVRHFRHPWFGGSTSQLPELERENAQTTNHKHPNTFPFPFHISFLCSLFYSILNLPFHFLVFLLLPRYPFPHNISYFAPLYP